jgi:hypothetical protein
VLAAFISLRQASKRFILVFYIVSTSLAKFMFPQYERDYCLITIYRLIIYIQGVSRL